MRKLYFLTFAAFVVNCRQPPPTKHTVETKGKGRYAKLLSKYRDISFDTLKVFSSELLESDQYKFKGTQLDSADVCGFPTEIATRYFDDHGFYACYKFAIDTLRIGLITRTPSTYEPSSIKLFFLNLQNGTITNETELAETFGDAGDVMEKTSWLFKDHDNKLTSFIWVHETRDNSIDDPKDTSIQTWNYYFLLDLSRRSIDTLRIDDKELKRTFARLLSGQTVH